MQMQLNYYQSQRKRHTHQRKVVEWGSSRCPPPPRDHGLFARVLHFEIHSFSKALTFLVYRKSLGTHPICSHLCICCRRESQNPTITMAQSLNPCVRLNPPAVSENLALKRTTGSAIPTKKKPFAPLLPTELAEYILTEAKQVCQDLCKQNYPFTNNKQIYS